MSNQRKRPSWARFASIGRPNWALEPSFDPASEPMAGEHGCQLVIKLPAAFLLGAPIIRGRQLNRLVETDSREETLRTRRLHITFLLPHRVCPQPNPG